MEDWFHLHNLRASLTLRTQLDLAHNHMTTRDLKLDEQQRQYKLPEVKEWCQLVLEITFSPFRNNITWPSIHDDPHFQDFRIEVLFDAKPGRQNLLLSAMCFWKVSITSNFRAQSLRTSLKSEQLIAIMRGHAIFLSLILSKVVSASWFERRFVILHTNKVTGFPMGFIH